MPREMMLAGRYRLRTVIGSGGMGRVWLGRDEMLARDVAVKEMLPLPGQSDLDRFDREEQTMREARATARLQHPNVVGVLDVVHTDRPWIVMEYVPSRSLYDVVTADGPLAPDAAARVGLSLLDALAAAHRAGIVHRDVKPHNVLIADGGRVVLTDFGLAVVDGGGDITRSDLVLGTPNYVAPERVRDGVSTVAADLWSLGATLYHAVEGRAPFQRPTLLGTLAALAIEPADPMRRAGPLKPAIAGLLERDPGRRLTEAQTRQRLVAAAAGRKPRRALNQPRRAWIAAAAAAIALAGGGAAVAAGRDDGTGAAPVSAGATTQPCLSPPDAGTRATLAGLPDTGPYALPPGWAWHRDPAGFRLGVPAGWNRYLDGSSVCFRDPDGLRVLAVVPAVTPTYDPTAFWLQRESQLLADRNLPGYRKVSIGPLLLGRGGAEWEYSFTGPDDRRVHGRQLVVATAPGNAYTLSWFAADREWELNEAAFQVAIRSYQPDG